MRWSSLILSLILFLGLMSFGGHSVAQAQDLPNSNEPSQVRLTNQRAIWLLKKLTGQIPISYGGEDPTYLTDRFTFENLTSVRDFLISYLESFGLTKMTTQEFDLRLPLRETHGKNIIAEIPGQSKEIVVIGAHYDTTGRNRPGANDNGTGVVALLEIARSLSKQNFKPSKTIHFAFFDTEELGGKQGSHAYFQKLSEQGKTVVAFLNLDMLGNNPLGDLVAGVDLKMPSPLQEKAKLLLIQANMGLANRFEFRHWGPYNSDSLAGENFGIPTIDLFEWPSEAPSKDSSYHPENHTAKDKLNSINIGYFKQMILLAGNLLIQLAMTRENWGSQPLRAKADATFARSTGNERSKGITRLVSKGAEILIGPLRELPPKWIRLRESLSRPTYSALTCRSLI